MTRRNYSFVLRTERSICFRFCSIRCRDEYLDFHRSQDEKYQIDGMYKAIDDEPTAWSCDQMDRCSRLPRRVRS